MEKFVNASVLNSTAESVNNSKVDSFIKKCNKRINKEKGTGKGFVSINNILDGLPTLNKFEMEKVLDEASKSGWELTQTDDNNNSVTYKIKIKNWI